MQEKILGLYNQRRRYVNLISSLLRGDRATAEDVVQEAFCRAVQYQNSFDPERGKIEAWFNRILFNSLRDVQRQAWGRPSDEPSEYCAEDLLIEVGRASPIEVMGLVEKSINDIKNEEHKRILTLFFSGGYTSTEISQIEEKTSPTNVTTIVARFRDQLMENFK